jgi:hypothetical protein
MVVTIHAKETKKEGNKKVLALVVSSIMLPLAHISTAVDSNVMH